MLIDKAIVIMNQLSSRHNVLCLPVIRNSAISHILERP